MGEEKTKSELVAIITGALEERLAKIKKGSSIELSPGTRLYGQGSLLDSIALVELLFEIEERVSGRYGVMVTLMDEKAMSARNSPFITIESLADYLATLVDKTNA